MKEIVISVIIVIHVIICIIVINDIIERQH